MKKKSKINEFNILGVTLQMIVTILVVIFLILGLISNKLFSYFYLFVGIDLIIMAYNNKKVFNKDKKIIIMYLVTGIIIIIYAILKFLGVV